MLRRRYTHEHTNRKHVTAVRLAAFLFGCEKTTTEEECERSIATSESWNIIYHILAITNSFKTIYYH